MRSAKSIAAGAYRSGADLATKATTHRRLVGGLNAVEADLLELSDADRATLAKAKALLGEIASTYARAAQLKKREEDAAAKRRKDVRAAMQDNFAAVTSVADKVAVIDFAHNSLPSAVNCAPHEARYLVGADFQHALDGLAWTVAGRDDVPPADAATAEWQRFLTQRTARHARHAALIAAVERLLTDTAKEPQPC